MKNEKDFIFTQIMIGILVFFLTVSLILFPVYLILELYEIAILFGIIFAVTVILVIFIARSKKN